jgi:hypothetical protein
MITIQELLFNRGLDKNAKTRIVRHKANRVDLYAIYRTDKLKFLEYQNQQRRNVFDDVEYIVSFIGEEGTLSRFIGVFKIINSKDLKTLRKSVDDGQYQYYYKMNEVEGFDDLKERVIIDWGQGARSWVQRIETNKKIVEIQPGLHYKQFTDYFDFILDFKELQEIVTNKYQDWKRMLTVTNCVYLISDVNTGKLYVGSTYGADGIWGRWQNYISTNGHGNNKTLKELIRKDEKYAINFRFSILMLLPKTITPDEAIKKEKIFKNKLGTNSFGLNNN